MTYRDLRNREILLELVHLLATYTVVNRDLVREVLTALFSVSKCIDRSVFLFDQAHIITPVEVNEELINKQNYMLAHTAGWKVMVLTREF